MATRITHCVCFAKSFAELKAAAERAGSRTVEELQTHIDFGFNCKLCHPYVRRMLKTGEIVFHQIIEE